MTSLTIPECSPCRMNQKPSEHLQFVSATVPRKQQTEGLFVSILTDNHQCKSGAEPVTHI